MKKNMEYIVSEDGQSIFEFIAFAPFYLVLMAVFINITAAINGSINQQKAVRGYFYHNIRGNSRILDRKYLNQVAVNGSLSEVGYYAMGYMEKQQGQIPEATCYEVKNFIPGAEEVDTCEGKPNTGDKKTNHIRVTSFLGMCSESYMKNGNGDLSPAIGNNGCVLKN